MYDDIIIIMTTDNSDKPQLYNNIIILLYLQLLQGREVVCQREMFVSRYYYNKLIPLYDIDLIMCMGTERRRHFICFRSADIIMITMKRTFVKIVFTIMIILLYCHKRTANNNNKIFQWVRSSNHTIFRRFTLGTKKGNVRISLVTIIT